MSAALLAELARLGVHLERAGDQVIVDGPESVLTDDLVAQIAAAKPAILAELAMGNSDAGRCVLSGCTEDRAPGDAVYCSAHRQAAEDGTLWLRCVNHADRPVRPGDPIACGECRERIDAPVGTDISTSEIGPPSPWRCYACRSRVRVARPAWWDWTCGQCGVIVAGPELTERPWGLIQRRAPVSGVGSPRVVWGQARGYLAVLDPATNTWHEIPYRDAPAVWQATVRRRNNP